MDEAPAIVMGRTGATMGLMGAAVDQAGMGVAGLAALGMARGRQ